MNDLNRCLSCGSEHVVYDREYDPGDPHGYDVHARCCGCGARSGNIWLSRHGAPHETYKKVADLWNRNDVGDKLTEANKVIDRLYADYNTSEKHFRALSGDREVNKFYSLQYVDDYLNNEAN